MQNGPHTQKGSLPSSYSSSAADKTRRAASPSSSTGGHNSSGDVAADADASKVNGDTFSFSAAGWLQMYHFGVCKAIQDTGLSEYGQLKFVGASAGSLACTAMVGKIDFSDLRAYAMEACADARKTIWNAFKIRKYVSTGVRRFATEPFNRDPDLKERAKKQLEVYVTVLPWLRAKRMSEFETVDDLEEALLASCCVTPLAGMPFPLRKTGEIVVDGGLAAFQPRSGEANVITVSPMYFSNVDIKPSVYIPATWGLYPPDCESYDKIFDVGYNDCIHFLVKSRRLPRRALGLIKNLDLPTAVHANPFSPRPTKRQSYNNDKREQNQQASSSLSTPTTPASSQEDAPKEERDAHNKHHLCETCAATVATTAAVSSAPNATPNNAEQQTSTTATPLKTPDESAKKKKKTKDNTAATNSGIPAPSSASLNAKAILEEQEANEVLKSEVPLFGDGRGHAFAFTPMGDGASASTTPLHYHHHSLLRGGGASPLLSAFRNRNNSHSKNNTDTNHDESSATEAATDANAAVVESSSSPPMPPSSSSYHHRRQQKPFQKRKCSACGAVFDAPPEKKGSLSASKSDHHNAADGDDGDYDDYDDDANFYGGDEWADELSGDDAGGQLVTLLQLALLAPVTGTRVVLRFLYNKCVSLLRRSIFTTFDLTVLLLFFVFVRLTALAVIYMEMFVASWVALFVALLQYIPVFGRRFRHKNFLYNPSSSLRNGGGTQRRGSAVSFNDDEEDDGDANGIGGGGGAAASVVRMAPLEVKKYLFPGESTDEDEGDFDTGSYVDENETKEEGADHYDGDAVARYKNAKINENENGENNKKEGGSQNRSHYRKTTSIAGLIRGVLRRRHRETTNSTNNAAASRGNNNNNTTRDHDADDDDGIDDLLGDNVIHYVKQQRLKMRERSRALKLKLKKEEEEQRQRQLNEEKAEGMHAGGAESSSALEKERRGGGGGGVVMSSDYFEYDDDDDDVGASEPDGVNPATPAFTAPPKRKSTKNNKNNSSKNDSYTSSPKPEFSTGASSITKDSLTTRGLNQKQQSSSILQQRRPTRRDTNRYTAVLGQLLAAAADEDEDEDEEENNGDADGDQQEKHHIRIKLPSSPHRLLATDLSAALACLLSDLKADGDKAPPNANNTEAAKATTSSSSLYSFTSLPWPELQRHFQQKFLSPFVINPRVKAGSTADADDDKGEVRNATNNNDSVRVNTAKVLSIMMLLPTTSTPTSSLAGSTTSNNMQGSTANNANVNSNTTNISAVIEKILSENPSLRSINNAPSVVGGKDAPLTLGQTLLLSKPPAGIATATALSSPSSGSGGAFVVSSPLLAPSTAPRFLQLPISAAPSLSSSHHHHLPASLVESVMAKRVSQRNCAQLAMQVASDIRLCEAIYNLLFMNTLKHILSDLEMGPSTVSASVSTSTAAAAIAIASPLSDNSRNGPPSPPPSRASSPLPTGLLSPATLAAAAAVANSRAASPLFAPSATSAAVTASSAAVPPTAVVDAKTSPNPLLLNAVSSPAELSQLFFRFPHYFGLALATNLELHRPLWSEAFKLSTCILPLPLAEVAGKNNNKNPNATTTSAASAGENGGDGSKGVGKKKGDQNSTRGGDAKKSELLQNTKLGVGAGGGGNTKAKKQQQQKSVIGSNEKHQKIASPSTQDPQKPYRYRGAWRDWYDTVRNLISVRVFFHLVLGKETSPLAVNFKRLYRKSTAYRLLRPYLGAYVDVDVDEEDGEEEEDH